jgi:integrase
MRDQEGFRGKRPKGREGAEAMRTKAKGIVRNADGTAAVDFVVSVPGSRSRIHIRKSGFPSVAEAREALSGLVDARLRDACPAGGSETFDALLDRYVAHRAARTRPQTSDCIGYMLKRHALPWFGGKTISKALSLQSVLSWHSRFSTDPGVSAARKNKVISEMRGLVKMAWEWRLVSPDLYTDLGNALESVMEPRRPKREKATWAIAEERRFLDAIPEGSMDHPMFSLFCELGCRIAELLGLQWQCLDGAARTVEIRQQVIRAHGKVQLTQELKTDDSYRKDRIGEGVAAELARYRAAIGAKPTDFMFYCGDPSRPMSKTELRRRMNHWIKASGVTKITPHGIRHTKATQYMGVCRNMEEAKLCARYLGHSATTMLDVYGHATDVDEDEIQRRLEKMERDPARRRDSLNSCFGKKSRIPPPAIGGPEGF